ncbi:nephrocystin-3 protein [Ceratobasidium sp. AG-Ba]|nr:nephrocystin-3 protein [Ceratobasidium sp. AG-Ba]
MDIDQAIEAHARLVENVFSTKKLLRTSGSGTYSASKLERELKRIVLDATGSENTHMIKPYPDEEKSKVMVFATSKQNLGLRVFRSYHGPVYQMPNHPIWLAMRASMAHPELFKSVEIGSEATRETLMGGGTIHSNPAPEVLSEVSAMYPDRVVSSIVCIGAGHVRRIQIPRPNPLRRGVPINVLMAVKRIATDSERVAEEMSARFINAPKVYYRFNVDQGIQDTGAGGFQQTNEVETHTLAYVRRPEIFLRLSEAASSIVRRRLELGTDSIGGITTQPSVRRTTGVKLCPVPSPIFTGRVSHVAQATTCLLGPPNERRVCVLHGPAGVGKTQIALKVMENTRDEWTDIVYVDASSQGTTKNTLQGFALAKGIGKTHEETIRWLETCYERWLLVFDDAYDSDLALFIPRGSHGSIMITTRSPRLASLGKGPGSDCKVSAVDSDEAIELLFRSAFQEDRLSTIDRAAALELVNNLHSSAPAIEQAGMLICRSGMSISEYGQYLLEMCTPSPSNVESYQQAVYATFMLILGRLSRRTQELLWLLVYLHHSTIREEIFQRAASHINRPAIIPIAHADDQAVRKRVADYLCQFLDNCGYWDSNAFSSDMEELVSYSLIGYDRMNKTYALHILTQQWARAALPYPEATARKSVAHLIALSIDRSDEIVSRMYRRGLITHIVQVHGELAEVDANDAEWFAKVYEDNERWPEAGKLWELVVSARESILGRNHSDTLDAMASLALSLGKQSQWEKAEMLQKQVLEIRLRAHGCRHSNTLAIMEQLATTYSVQGRQTDAEALYSQALDAKISATPISRHMPVSEVIGRLCSHGCLDITDQLNASTGSDIAISTGGSGNVYKVELKDGTLVAVKTMRIMVGSSHEDEDQLMEVARELHTWSKCSHPNVLKLRGLAIFRDQIGMVSSWMHHGDLPTFLSRSPPQIDRYQLSSQICEGLVHLHDRGIVHGDLKGLNVLISNSGIPMLTDFGNSLLRNRTLEFTGTAPKNKITSRWAAPELLSGLSVYSREADVYALGMQLQETITGRVPYCDKAEEAIYHVVVVKREIPSQPESISSNNEYGDMLWGLLKSCWLYEPIKRPSAEAVAKAIKAIIYDMLAGDQSEGEVESCSKRS